MDAGMDWGHLAFLLAVHRAGSLAGAARALGVDATTVGRRLTALEAEVGAPLFRRGPRGQTPTDLGERLLALAVDIDERVAAVRRDASAQHHAPEGVVRLTTSEFLATHVVAPALPRLWARHPGLVVDVVTTMAVLDLARGEADLALRIVKPTERTMVRRRLGALSSSAWTSAEYLRARRASPGDLGAGAGLTLVGYGLAATPPEDVWLTRALPEAKMVLRTGSIGMALAAVAAGVGIGVLPDGAAARLGLVPLPALGAPPPRAVWLVMHPTLAKVPRVRAVAKLLGELFDTSSR